MCQALLPEFERRRRGKIVNIGSIFGHTGFPGSAGYCGTKAAIHLMTKTLGIELRERNIQVNAIAPGFTETPLNEGYRATNEEWMRRADERFGGPGVWMKPEELAGAAVFLASSEFRFRHRDNRFRRPWLVRLLSRSRKKHRCGLRLIPEAHLPIWSSRKTMAASSCSRRRPFRRNR